MPSLFRPFCTLLTLAGACFGGISAHAQYDADSFGDSRDVVGVTSVVSVKEVRPGDAFVVAVVFEIKPGWHIWTSEASLKTAPPDIARYDGAIWTTIALESKEATTPIAAGIDSIQWPEFHNARADLGEGPQNFSVYEGRAIAFLPIQLALDAQAGPLSIPLVVSFQSCNDSVCMAPADVSMKVSVNVGPSNVPAAEMAHFANFDPSVLQKMNGADSVSTTAPSNAVEFRFFRWSFSIGTDGVGFFYLLLVAATGGFLLNLTPCVLPVIPLKVMGLAASADNPRHAFFLASVMSAGVICFWLALGLALSFITGFEQANQLFQFPAFTIGVGVFIAIMAIGMAGFFSIGLPSWLMSIETKNESTSGAFLFGIMTAILSTPCTAPLMGAAAGWAVTTESPTTILSVFAAIGAGMASPYLLLSAFPKLVARVPRAGEGSEVVKQVMGLLLLGAAAYFIGAGINQVLATPSAIYWWFVAAIGASAGLWLTRQTLRIARGWRIRTFFSVIGIAIAASSVYIGVELGQGERIHWTTYSPEVLDAALKDGDVVVLNFTADWCINCKTLEKGVLESNLVAGLLDGDDVLALKADIGREAAAKDKLRSEGFVTIPLLIVIAPNGETVLKATDYTPDQVAQAIEKARGMRTQ
ncbi:MAG: thioredoxin family protein [Planctomycetota bacterium]|nr:thioredoxin family protein [Planctomycetota bacterium]